jgi:formate C-acetyltransferase
MRRIDLLKSHFKDVPHLSIKPAIWYTRSMQETEGKPQIIRQALALKCILENLPVIIRPGELIVGTPDEEIPVAIFKPEGKGLRLVKELESLPTRKAEPIIVKKEDIETIKEEIYPYWSKRSIENYALELIPKEVLEAFLRFDSFIVTNIAGISHVVIDYPRLLSTGLGRYVKWAEENIANLEKSAEPDSIDKITFYKAIKIVAEALIKYACKYAKKASEMAVHETDPVRKEELKKIAVACNWVPENPPRNFHEALQFIWFIQLALHLENIEHGISFGRMDQYLFPYYKRDLEEGIMTREEALELMECFLLKINEIAPLQDTEAMQFIVTGGSKVQGLTLGGVDKEGRDATNELTYLILDAVKEVAMPDPNVAVRFHENSPEMLYEKVSEIMASGLNILALVNDKVMVEALRRYGVSLEDAMDYALIGCVGLSTSGKGFDNTGAVFINLAKPLELALDGENPLARKMGEEVKKPEQFSSMEDVIDAYKKYLGYIVKLAVIAANSLEYTHQQVKPTPLMSLCVNGCFEAGKDVTLGPTKYKFTGIFGAGFPDVVNSLAAIEYAVFREKRISMKELAEALKRDFSGYELLRQYLLNRCPKYGNDDEFADKYARLIVEIFAEEVSKYRNVRGGKFRPGIHANATHVGFGLRTGALPSGRRRGEPLGGDLAPVLGTSAKGITATLRSVAKIDLSLLGNGMACTVTVDPNLARMRDPKGSSLLTCLVKSYFQLGGSHVQVNVLSPDILREAQKNPEKYRHLVVRVSGFSARFVDLPKELQDEIINRYVFSA